MKTISHATIEQDTHHQDRAVPPLPGLFWLLLSAVGGAFAALIVTGIVAGRSGIAISPALLLAGAVVGALPRLIALVRRRWEAQGEILLLGLLSALLIGLVPLGLAWPNMLPLGRSVDAVHQFQLVHWISSEQRLPMLDTETRSLLGEMIAYPPGLAFVVSALAALARTPDLETLFPTVALLGGMCAGLAALLAANAAGVRGARLLLPGLAVPLLLLAHRVYFLEAYIDLSYYAQMLGLTLALLAVGWLVCEPRLGWLGALQLGLVLAALLASYPLWLPVPALCAVVVVVGRWWPARHEPQSVRRMAGTLALVALPPLLLAALDLPARLATGQLVLEHQGVVTPPTAFELLPLLLAVPAAGLVWLAGWRGRVLLLACAVGLAALLALAGAAQLGLVAPYHSVKMLFLLVPLGAAVVAAALIRLTLLRPAVRWPALAAAALLLVFTSVRFVWPITAEQVPNRDLVAAARWLRANDAHAADRAIAVGAPTGPLSYWVQVALLGQQREQATAAMNAFTNTPPTPEGWAIDTALPKVAIVPSLGDAPPGSEVLQRFGSVAVLQRTTLDPAQANPLVVRYATRWEEGRLKSAFEVLHAQVGQLPLLEVLLIRDGTLINRFELQPNPEKLKTQYLGIDLIPETLGGVGYVNSDYPTFAPPAEAPTGSFLLALRLTLDGNVLDERLLASFERTADSALPNLSMQSGELDYVQHSYPSQPLNLLDTHFGPLALTGWNASQEPDRATLDVFLRWQLQAAQRQRISTELRLLDPKGTVVAESRAAPQNGFYPVWRWRPGEDVTELRRLDLPRGLPGGTYTLVAGVFDEASQQPLALTAGQAELGQIVITP